MSTTSARATLPLVAVAHGPRSVPALQLAGAAAGVCNLLWLIDGRITESTELARLLLRFGPVVDIGGLDPHEAATRIAEYHPAGLATYFDADMVGLATIAADLGLPFASPQAAIRLVDKLAQRRALCAAGLPTPRYWLLPPGPAEHALRSLGPGLTWPAVLKPRSDSGSHHTFLARDREHAAALLDGLGGKRGEMIVEEYLSDDPSWAVPYADYVSVESIVSGGRASHLAVTGRFPCTEMFRETGFFMPAALTTPQLESVLQLATGAIAALGVETGCLHTEIKFTAQGPGVIELNGRLGLGIPDMLDQAAGFGILQTSLRVALGEQVVIDGPVPCHRVGYRFYLQPPAIVGSVEHVEGVAALTDHPGVNSVSVHRGPGSAIDWRDGTRCYILAVVGVADDHAGVEEAFRLMHDKVTVSYSTATVSIGGS